LPNSAYANQNDFVIYDSSGNKYSIIMDPTGLDRLSPDYDPMDGLPNDPTVQDVINLINAQIPGDTVVADFNSTHTGLQLYDKLGDDTDATTAQFRAETINGSGALLTLGFFSAGNEGTQNQFEDGNRYLIEGGPIGETHLDDRFFVRDAELWGALKLKTPNTPEPGEAAMETPGAVGSALFGIVGVDTYLSGTMYAEFTAAIKNPNTGVAGGTATLLELFEGAKQGRLTQDASFDVTIQGESPVTVTVFKSATIDDESTPNIDEANDTLANLVADVNQALQAAGLGTQIFARAAGTRIEFVSKVKDNPSTKLDDESIQFTIEAGGLGAAELGLSGTLASEYVEGEQVIAARSASRWAVAEPVVTAASELSYYTGPAPATTVIPFAGGFTTGQVLIGYAAEEVYDGDGVLIGYNLTETGKAKVVENRYNSETLGGVLRLTDVEGAFNTAEWLQAEGTASYAYHSPGEVATRANFGDFILEVHVQDGFNDPGFVAGDGTHGFGLLDGEIYTAPFTITDFGNPYDPAPPVAEFDDLVGDTGDLYAFINLDYADIGSALHELLDLLVDVDKNFGLLNLELPAIGKSISELLGLVDDFERGVSNIDEIFAAALLALDPEAVDLPALTLQDIPNALRGTFGFPEGGDPDVDGVKLDFNIGSSSDPEDGMLLINFNIHESIDTKLGLDITVDENLPNITSSGVLQVNGALDMHLSFGMDLAEPNNAYLFDDTTISAELHVQGEGQTYETSDPLDQDKDGMGLVFRASLGPLAVFIQDGDAKIDVAFSMGMDFGGSDRKRISDVDANRDDDVLTDFDDPVITENYADIVLPMFYGGEGPDNYLGNFEAHGQLVNPATLGKGTLTVEVPDFSGIEADILSGKIEFDPFEYILLAIDTLNLYLENLSDMLASEVLGIQLPFVGDQMADILFIENFRNAIYSTLKNGIANDIDPTPDDVTGLLEGALAAYLVGPVDDSDFDVSSDNIADWYRQWNFTLHDNETIYLTDFDLGIPNLGFDVDIPVKVVLDWTLDIGFGVSFAEGAYIEVSDGNELDIDLTITLPTVGKGMLGFLRTDVTDPGSDTGAVLNFDVNVKNGETANERLGFSDIGKINPDATVWGRSLAEARPVAPVDDSDVVTLHLETKAEWGMPQLMADLIMDWAIPEGTKVNTLNGNAVTPDIEGIGVNYIALNDMEFNAGSVATSLLEPIFGEILGYIEPFMPVIDVLTAPIPVLSDLAGEPFTLLDLAAIFGSVDAEFIDTIADILDVISMIDAAMEQTILELGDLVLYDYSAGITNFDPTDPESKLSEIDLTTLDPASGLTLDTEFNNNEGNDFLEFIRSDPSPVKGLTMPIFTDARQTIGMFLNQNAVMVDYKLPPLAVEFEYLQVFPVFGPLAVSIEISFGFTVDLHSVGFDTYGYQRYAKGGFYNPEVMFDGFYLNDLDAEDVDAPEVLFEFGLVGAAELNLGIARAGVGGGIKAQIFFDWHDPIADGRVHISELIANVETADDNPLAVFDVGGALTFQLFAFLEISIIGFEKEFPITPETELFSFEEEFSHDPILATDIGGGVLMLNMGPTALDRIYGDISDGSESVTVTGSGTNSVTVGGKTFDNISHIIGIGGQGNDSIILNLGDDSIITYELDGGLGDDTITVTGGAGKGVIIGGVGNDILTGGDGNDTIYGGEGNDLIHGGGGQDIIFGDQGRSVQTSAYITTPYITSRVTSADGNDEIYGDDGDDIIIGAGGDDELSGDAGNDILIGDGGRFAYTPTGLDGHIDVASLRPADFVVPEIIPTDGTLPKTPEEISADINGIFDELMETFHSTDLFFGGNDVIHGGENDDMMFGGSGDDMLYGDGGKDLIVAGKGFDEVFGGAGNDTIFGNDQADIISGEGDDDVISGGSGNDYIHGNGGNDVMKGDSGADIIFGDDGDDQLFGLTEPDILFGGIGNDLVVGGTSNDIMFGDDGVVAKLNPDYDPDTDSDSAIGYKVIFNDILITRSEVDSLLASVQNNEGDSWWDDDERSLDLIHTYVKASDGNDILSGEAADDMMFGGGGNDLMGGDVDPRLPNAGGPTDISEDVLIGDGGMITFDQRRFRSISTVKAPVVGTDFDDTIYGDNGNDYIFGGWGSDYLFGGHGKVVDISQGVDGVGAYRGDTDEGAGDADIIFGDNGRIDFAAYSAEHPDNFGILTKAYTTDTVETTGADDYIEGELDNDIIFGGVNNEEVDRLFGHEGRDVVLGDNGMVEFDLDPDMNLATLDRIKSFLDHLGGTDEVSGSQDYDVLIGGTGGDRMYGDDVAASNGSADGKDIMLGDNGWVDLLDAAGPGSVGPGSDLFAFFGGAVVTVRTSDGDPSVDPYAILDDATTGGIDYMYGNYDDDIMAGGAWGDFLYGSVGDDLILGDAARFEWLYDGSEVSVFEKSQNDLLEEFDNTFNTLDLVTTKQPTFGGRDTIDGEADEDTAFGGTDSDLIHGGTEDDILFGDHGRYYPQHSTLAAFASRNFFAIDMGDGDGGDGDRMYGDAGDDSMFGQQGDDRMWGNDGDDDMTGGHNVPGGIDEITTGKIAATLNPPVNDLMDGGAGDDAMAGDNAIIWRRGDELTPDDLSPRFQVLTDDTIYTTTVDTITANINGVWQSDPADADGRDITLIDHSDTIEAMPAGPRLFGADVMAGGADSDTMFGELGNDLMQGDGAIETTPMVQHVVGYPDFISRTLTVDDSGSNPDTDQTLYFNIPEQTSDADDYMEGNGGSDLMYGGLGQDDMIGGSSALFGLTSEQMRPDTTDYIYGGAGIATMRNDIGATSFGLASEDGDTHLITTLANGHSRDADFIMGDNANVYRLVNSSDEFLNFNYDDAYGLQIIPRAMEQLDYTLGGSDYEGGSYTAWGAANADNGAADLIHGESGDDTIFGMTGSDVIFGEGQDDDIVGGYGHDWISGGTGQDGVLGDDGLILTSRNSTLGEPLYGIAGLLAKDPRPKYADGNVLNEVIATPGSIQYAVINLTGELKKTIDLVPFSYDPAWNAMDDEFPDNQDDSPRADDIIFGGLGTDWLHGGSGDDAISGAEALADAYVPVYDAAGTPIAVLDLGYSAVDLPAAAIVPGDPLTVLNPGDVLAFNPTDVLTDHTNNRDRAGEFALYNEYDPRRTILLTPTGVLYTGTEGVNYFQFLLNFEETEGVVRPAGTVPKATGQETESYPAVNDDGKDSIFGDLGNDWLVGGTGRDNLYGGWGNDLLNADDDHDGHLDVNELNDFTDTHPYYEDRAYGGAGRDVLIGNTGGDRLIDWVGEYNSYLVPYAPFGQASVSRTLQPFLPDFLYALSAGDGADPTRENGLDDDPRNGEPDAEMGLVLQKDFAWQDQTGAPADPQAGNIPGGARDVLRSATFNDATNQGFTAASGTWLLKSGVYYVEPTLLGTDAVSVWNHGETLPSYFELTATVTPVKPIAGYKANAFIVFDYYSDEDFKFAGINSSTNKIEIGQRTAAGWQVLTSTNMLVKAGTSYNLLVALNGTTATIRVNNGLTLSYGFAPRVVAGMIYNFNDSGMIGLGADNAKAAIDNVNLMVLPPTITFTCSEDFSTTPALLSSETGDWTISSEGYYVGTPATGESLALAGGSLRIGANYLLQLETKIATEKTGGIIFDQYATDDFKWAGYEKDTNRVMLGHYTDRDGWVVDKSIIIKNLDDGDVTLSLTLKGTTVSVLVNGAAALSHVYNSVLTDGEFGLLAKDGSASFDFFTVKTDDPNVENQQLLTASTAPETPINDGGLLSETDLVPIVKEAIARWENVSGVDGARLAALYDLDFRVVDFTDLTLGKATPDTIYIDADAAGWGWFVDETPEDDVEFVTEGGEDENRMDLLTTVMHEIGHVLGYDDAADDADTLMRATLDAGERYVPDGDSLVVMDGSDLSDGMEEEPDFVPTAKVEDPWLINFLVKKARKDYNPFEPVESIRILVTSDEEDI
jgi:Ca2+-binding RTX toxin-like protein